MMRMNVISDFATCREAVGMVGPKDTGGGLPPPTESEVGEALTGIRDSKEAEGEGGVATSWKSLRGPLPPLLHVATTETAVG